MHTKNIESIELDVPPSRLSYSMDEIHLQMLFAATQLDTSKPRNEKVVVEIGSMNGDSTRVLIEALNRGLIGHLHVVEIAVKQELRDVLSNAVDQDRVTLHDVASWHGTIRQADMVFIDGDHTWPAFLDLLMALSWGASVICLHDSTAYPRASYCWGSVAACNTLRNFHGRHWFEDCKDRQGLATWRGFFVSAERWVDLTLLHEISESNKPTNLAYIISSHVEYQSPRRILVKSMLDCGIDPTRIVVVVGGGGLPDNVGEGQPEEVRVDYNSYDFTGMIWVTESLDRLLPETDRFVFLHDTMVFGERSDELFNSTQEDSWATAAESDAQCNLVCYHRDYLKSRAYDIQALKNCDKTTAINFERHFWRSCPEKHRYLYPRAECIPLGEDHPYGGSLRRKEYYPAVDITKWKANWGQPVENPIVEP